MRLHDPWVLVLLGLAILLIRLPRRQTPATLRFPLLGALRAVGTGRRSHWRWVLPALRVAIRRSIAGCGLRIADCAT